MQKNDVSHHALVHIAFEDCKVIILDEEDIPAFGDSGQASSWAKDSIATCIKADVLPSQMTKTLSPKVKITRSEVAVIIRQLLLKSNLI